MFWHWRAGRYVVAGKMPILTPELRTERDAATVNLKPMGVGWRKFNPDPLAQSAGRRP